MRGRHPLQTSDAVGAAQSQIGPNAQASIVYLNKRAGMSYGKIADYFREANGIQLRPSTATRIVLRVARKLQPTYQEIKDYCERMGRLTQGPRAHEANDIFAGHLHRYSNTWFTFLLDPDRVSATNSPIALGWTIWYLTAYRNHARMAA